MLGNFTYCNPTRIHFGADALNHLLKSLVCMMKLLESSKTAVSVS